jgi:hypothetical protein
MKMSITIRNCDTLLLPAAKCCESLFLHVNGTVNAPKKIIPIPHRPCSGEGPGPGFSTYAGNRPPCEGIPADEERKEQKYRGGK